MRHDEWGREGLHVGQVTHSDLPFTRNGGGTIYRGRKRVSVVESQTKKDNRHVRPCWRVMQGPKNLLRDLPVPKYRTRMRQIVETAWDTGRDQLIPQSLLLHIGRKAGIAQLIAHENPTGSDAGSTGFESKSYLDLF